VYPHVALTEGGYYNPAFLLDTKLGRVYWNECDSNIKKNPPWEPIMGEYYSDNIPKDEVDWRGDSVAWAIPDFFELLKDQFRQLLYIPISQRRVCYAITLEEGKVNLADVYRAQASLGM
jgi:hypothetical protein